MIKGVKTWQNGEWRHYSELDLIQMMGRAVCLVFAIIYLFNAFAKGRPQFGRFGSQRPLLK